VGTFFSQKRSRDSENYAVSWVDVAIMVIAIVIVRLMAHGIASAP